MQINVEEPANQPLPSKPFIASYPLLNFLSTIKWAAPLLDLMDYHQIWHAIAPEQLNDTAFFHELVFHDDYGTNSDKVIDFNKLLVQEYEELEENQMIIFNLSW